jgi:hypothetical protein
MPIKLFDPEWLQEDVIGGNYVKDTIIGHTRWTVDRRCIFLCEEDARLYRVDYCLPATELQECDTFYDMEGDMVRCHEVESYKVEVTRYRDVKP